MIGHFVQGKWEPVLVAEFKLQPREQYCGRDTDRAGEGEVKQDKEKLVEYAKKTNSTVFFVFFDALGSIKADFRRELFTDNKEAWVRLGGNERLLFLRYGGEDSELAGEWCAVDRPE